MGHTCSRDSFDSSGSGSESSSPSRQELDRTWNGTQKPPTQTLTTQHQQQNNKGGQLSNRPLDMNGINGAHGSTISSPQPSSAASSSSSSASSANSANSPPNYSPLPITIPSSDITPVCRPLSTFEIAEICQQHFHSIRPSSASVDPDYDRWDLCSKVLYNRLRLTEYGPRIGRKSLPFMLASGEMLRKWVRSPLYTRAIDIMINKFEVTTGMMKDEETQRRWYQQVEKETGELVQGLRNEGRNMQISYNQLLANDMNNALTPWDSDQQKSVNMLRYIRLLLPGSINDRPSHSAYYPLIPDPARREWLHKIEIAFTLLALQRAIQAREESVQIAEELLLQSLSNRVLSQSLTPLDDIRDLLESLFYYWRVSVRLTQLYKSWEIVLKETGKEFHDIIMLFQPIDTDDTNDGATPTILCHPDSPAVIQPLKSILKRASFAEGDALDDSGKGGKPFANGTGSSIIEMQRRSSFQHHQHQPYWVQDMYVAHSIEREESLSERRLYFILQLLLRGIRYKKEPDVSPITTKAAPANLFNLPTDPAHIDCAPIHLEIPPSDASHTVESIHTPHPHVAIHEPTTVSSTSSMPLSSTSDGDDLNPTGMREIASASSLVDLTLHDDEPDETDTCRFHSPSPEQQMNGANEKVKDETPDSAAEDGAKIAPSKPDQFAKSDGPDSRDLAIIQPPPIDIDQLAIDGAK